MTAEQRAFATEWAEAEIRVVRNGEDYTLQIRARDDVGFLVHYTVGIEEREAGDLRGVWVEVP